MADKQTQNLDTTTPTLDDVTVSFDYASPTELKKTTWQAVIDLFKTYFDTIYQAVLVSWTNIKTVNSQSLLGSGDIVISGSGDVATDAIWDAKWDLAGWTGANTASRLAVGTNGQVLVADSAEVTGMKWATASGTGDMLASTYDPAGIAQQVAGLTATQTFSTGLKTFLSGMFGLRNVANTFTSFFTNTNTASRTYTLQDSSDTLVWRATTDTLTNKRVTRRLVAVTQSATPAINTDNMDIASITWLAQAITSMTSSLTGTPVNGDMMMIQITDNGTARAITWGASFASANATLPTTTVISTLLRVLVQWNSTTSKWECIA